MMKERAAADVGGGSFCVGMGAKPAAMGWVIA